MLPRPRRMSPGGVVVLAIVIAVLILVLFFRDLSDSPVSLPSHPSMWLGGKSKSKAKPGSLEAQLHRASRGQAAPDYNHTVSARLPQSPLSARECGAISSWDVQARAERTRGSAAPVVYVARGGAFVTVDSSHAPVGTSFCAVFMVPQTPREEDGEYQNPPVEGWGPDALHALTVSDDVTLIFEHPDYWGMVAIPGDGEAATAGQVAVYTAAYTLNHPGTYEMVAEVEFANYDWVMEDPVDLLLGEETLPYAMLERKFECKSALITVTGKPASRPTAKCYHDGHNDLRGRWYKASAFKKGGGQTRLNPEARLEFAEHNTTTDEWGWTFAPDACSLTYFSAADHLDCFAGRSMQCLCDSNSRRTFKSLMGGGVGWCQDPQARLCNCEDHWEESFPDALFRSVDTSRLRDSTLRDTPTRFGRNASLWFDYVGGMVNKKTMNAWDFFYDYNPASPSILHNRQAAHGPIDLVHISLLGWDMAAVRDPGEVLAGLPAFRGKVLAAYGKGTRFVTRLANSLCCGNVNPKVRYSGPRFAIWNAMWRAYWTPDEEAGLVRIVDPSVLQGRRDAETRNACPTTHLRASHVRLEQMMWMAAVCEKPGGKGAKARMRDWGL